MELEGLEEIGGLLSGDGSEFIDGLLKKIWQSIYLGLWDTIEKEFGWLQGVLTYWITSSKDVASQSPQEWNSSAFSFVQGVAENAAIPIAGCIITFVFCWQIIGMVQESNQMHNITPEIMIILLLKLGICLFVCSKSFEIVNGLFDLAAWAVSKTPFSVVSSSDVADLNDILPREQTEYTFGMCGILILYLFITFLAVCVTFAIGIAIYVRVNIWYLELLIYASAAPIPFATFMNKEWGQTGTNYLRKMLAVSFEGFFMLIAFGLYGAMSSYVLSGSSAGVGDSYIMSMFTTVGCGVGLFMIIAKAGSISASIFNAH